MKKILTVILILLFAFAFIRIASSTYENKKRRNNTHALPTYEHSIITSFLVLT